MSSIVKMKYNFSNPLNIAVLFEENIKSGGGYNQSLNSALLTKSVDPKIAKFTYITTHKDNTKNLKEYGIDSITYRSNYFSELFTIPLLGPSSMPWNNVRSSQCLQ